MRGKCKAKVTINDEKTLCLECVLTRSNKTWMLDWNDSWEGREMFNDFIMSSLSDCMNGLASKRVHTRAHIHKHAQTVSFADTSDQASSLSFLASHRNNNACLYTRVWIHIRTNTVRAKGNKIALDTQKTKVIKLQLLVYGTVFLSRPLETMDFIFLCIGFDFYNS